MTLAQVLFWTIIIPFCVCGGKTSTKSCKTPKSFSKHGPYLHTVIPGHQELATADAAMESGLLLCLVQPADRQNQGLGDGLILTLSLPLSM